MNYKVCIVRQNISYDIKILHCGIEEEPTHFRFKKKLERCVLSYLFDGEGTYTLNKKNYRIKKGDVYLIPRGEEYSQRTSEKKPYKYFYIAFLGIDHVQLMERAGLSKNNPIISLDAEGQKIVHQYMQLVYEELTKNTFLSITRANIYFLEILQYLFSRDEKNNVPCADGDFYVEMAKTYIQDNFKNNITVKEIAKFLRINRSYLSQLFSEREKITIKSYITACRIEYAIQILLETDKPCSKIGEEAGFTDNTSFYRQFKKLVGHTPYEYRRETKQTVKENNQIQ